MPIVEAVGIAAVVLDPASRSKAGQLEAAMQEELQACFADGLRANEDAAEIRRRMLVARDKVKETW